MLCVKEIFDNQASLAAKKFLVSLPTLSRVMAVFNDFECTDILGIAVIALVNGKIEITDISQCDCPSTYDLLARSLLSLLRELNRIEITVAFNLSYFTVFGFKISNQKAKIINKDIIFTCQNK